tara:strand:- start:129 stop:311 length:183 start_codon:yes stop_codon:yes gene_type:complete
VLKSELNIIKKIDNNMAKFSLSFKNENFISENDMNNDVSKNIAAIGSAVGRRRTPKRNKK